MLEFPSTIPDPFNNSIETDIYLLHFAEDIAEVQKCQAISSRAYNLEVRIWPRRIQSRVCLTVRSKLVSPGPLSGPVGLFLTDVKTCDVKLCLCACVFILLCICLQPSLATCLSKGRADIYQYLKISRLSFPQSLGIQVRWPFWRGNLKCG